MAKKNSVYDFLYVDWDRISSLTSQMDEMGVLMHISETHSKDVVKRGKLGGTTEGSLGVDSTKASVSAKAEASSDKKFARSHARNFNARFALPINFLDLLTDNDLIHKNQEDWSVGRIGLFKGTLTIADMTAMLPGMKASTTDNDIQLAVSILGEMPSTAQGILVKGGTKIWSVYDVNNWVAHPASLALSHGARIDGQWAIIGIIDAKPNESPLKANASLFSTAMSAMVDFSEVIREEMGRPKNCYGFTPLLVFREVK